MVEAEAEGAAEGEAVAAVRGPCEQVAIYYLSRLAPWRFHSPLTAVGAGGDGKELGVQRLLGRGCTAP